MDTSTQPTEPTGTSGAMPPADPFASPVQPAPAPAEPADDAIQAPVDQPQPAPEPSQDVPTELVSDLPPIPAPEEAPSAAGTQPPVAMPSAVMPEATTDPSTDAYEPEQPTSTHPMTYEPADPDLSVPSSAEAGMPDVSDMELDEPFEDEPKQPMDTRKLAKTMVGVFIVLVAGLLIKQDSSTLGTHKLKSKGYTYSFKFYRHSSLFTYGDGTTALKHASNSVGSAKPAPNDDTTNCTEVGNGWKETFVVNINDVSVPVCTPDNKTYIAVFNGAGHKQLFTVTYNTVQKSDTLPILKTIFESISVKK